MLSEPRWFYDNPTKTLVITLIQIDSDKNLAKSGIVTIQMKIEPLAIDATNTIIKDYTPDTKTVYINYKDVQSDYYRAWENYFGSTLEMQKDGSDWKIDDVQRLVIKAYKVTVLDL